MKQKTILLELLRWLCAGLAVVFLVVSFRAGAGQLGRL